MSQTQAYLKTDTIVALATALGGPIAVIRISGPRAFEIAKSFGVQLGAEERGVQRVMLTSGERTLDEAVVSWFRNPKSFTGEDVIEFSLHGGPAVVLRALDHLKAAGARQALPGEFSFRAVRNGKFSVYQAQAISDLISATSEAGAELALEKLKGEHRGELSALGEELRSLSVFSEVGIDFSDQDVEEVSLPVLKKRSLAVKKKLEALYASFEKGRRIQNGITLTFVGEPNAGKSTLFNALLGESRAIVSEIPGTTRDTLSESWILKREHTQQLFKLVDTAGLRATHDPIEKEGMARATTAASETDLLAVLVAADEFEKRKGMAAQTARKFPGKRAVLVVTKSDLAKNDQSKDWALKNGFGSCVLVSAKTHEGLEPLKSELFQLGQTWLSRKPGEVILTQSQQVDAVRDAIEQLDRAQNVKAEDLFASDIRQALFSLAPLIGETTTDEILGRIFSGFCIGK